MTQRLFIFLGFVLGAISSTAAPAGLRMEDPCNGSYTGFYDGVGPLQFDFIRLQDDVISVRLRYHGAIHQGQGLCRARGEDAHVFIQFNDAPSHEGDIHRESDRLMFRGFQAADGLSFTAEKR